MARKKEIDFGKKRNLPFGLAIGFGLAVTALVVSFAIPFTPLTVPFGLAELDDSPFFEGDPAGVRLQIGDFRIHHYMFAFILIPIGVVFYFKRRGAISYILFGFSAILIVDQLPNLLANDFGETAKLSLFQLSP